MCKEKRSKFKAVPAIILSATFIVGAVLKIAGIHPMIHHFNEMGLSAYLPILGITEIVGVVLFLIPATQRSGLLLLTAYLGGAMAAEIPYHMVMAPGIPLALLWIAAFIRKPSQFIESSKQNLSFA